MIRVIACLSALAVVTAAQAQTLQRHNHHHTIYIVHGSSDQLDKFHEQVGSQWQGGTLIEKDNLLGLSRYWAYSERTAAQARQFMFGSMMSGLELDMEEYDESRLYPAERSELDAIAIRCGFGSDPFFISPKREVQVSEERSPSSKATGCALKELKTSSSLRELPVQIVGGEAPTGEAH